MRVIGGSARGIALQTVPGTGTRPILDRLKKSLFSMLDAAELIEGRRVLDLYAGAGTLGIEALSRGAQSCLFVERQADAVALLRVNLGRTHLVERAEVFAGEVAAFLRRSAPSTSPVAPAGYGLVFYDPPFVFSREPAARPALEAELARAGELLVPGGCLIQRAEKLAETPTPPGLTLARHWTDGPHALSFFFRTAGTGDQAPGAGGRAPGASAP